MDSRISAWAVKFNVAIKPAVIEPGKPYYRVKDIFTSRDGSWEVTGVEGGVPQWARDTYLRPWGSVDYFDEAGGDRHVFGAIFDEAGRVVNKAARFKVYNWTDGSGEKILPVKTRSGWFNELAQNLYFPDMDGNVDTGNRGPWAWRPEMGIPADTVVGGGMPFNWHVSVFATWVLDTGGIVQPPPSTLEAKVEKLESWAVAWSIANPGGPQYVRG